MFSTELHTRSPEQFISLPSLSNLQEYSYVSSQPFVDMETKLKPILTAREWVRTIPEMDKSGDTLKHSGILASEVFSWYFGRDTFKTLLGIIHTHEDFQSAYLGEDQLVSVLLTYLEWMSKSGLLPHETGSKSMGYPFEVGSSGFGFHNTSVDVNGLAIITIDKMLDLYPQNQLLYERTRKPLERLTRWTLRNLDKHHGTIGYSASGVGSREKIWTDGANAILDKNTQPVAHPFSHVEEMGIYWSALNRAADKLALSNPKLGRDARYGAKQLQINFNKKFVYEAEDGQTKISLGIDGHNQRLTTDHINILLALGYTYNHQSILSPTSELAVIPYLSKLVSALQTPYGLRTQAVGSPEIPGYTYHGSRSLWPVASIMATRSLLATNTLKSHFYQPSIELAKGNARLILAFGSLIETAQLQDNGKLTLYQERRSDNEIFTSSLHQAWSWAWSIWNYELLKQQVGNS
jgi:glycogen debranching enzyme